MVKQKKKLKIDELMKGIDGTKVSELMNPLKPFNRKLNIEIINFKDEAVKEKIPVKLDAKGIQNLIVEYNLSSNDVLSIKKARAMSYIKSFDFLRMSEYASKSGRLLTRLHRDLSYYFNGGRSMNWDSLHERIFIITREGNMDYLGFIGVNWTDKIKQNAAKENIGIEKFSGDITYLKLFSRTTGEDLLRVITQKLKRLPILRIRLDRTTTHINEISKALLDADWRMVGVDSDGEDVRYCSGWYPRNVLVRYGCIVGRNNIVVSTTLKEHYMTDWRKMEEERRRKEEMAKKKRKKTKHKEVLERELGGQEITKEVVLEEGTKVVIQDGSEWGRSERGGEAECTIVRLNEESTDRHGEHIYLAEFQLGNKWYIRQSEILRIVTSRQPQNSPDWNTMIWQQLFELYPENAERNRVYEDIQQKRRRSSHLLNDAKLDETWNRFTEIYNSRDRALKKIAEAIKAYIQNEYPPR